MPLPQYGDPHGIADRLEKWAETLSLNKSYPWPGTGLLADLKAAAVVIRSGDGEPKKTPVEYDL